MSQSFTLGATRKIAWREARACTIKFLFADEPIGNLDTTLVMVTHDKELATYADRVITLRDGILVSDERKPA